MAAVSTVKEFYPYLNGFSFTLVIDHNPLISLKGTKRCGWSLGQVIYLQHFIFKRNIDLEEHTVMLMHCPKDLPLSQ